MTSVNEASRAGIPRKLRKTLVISLRLQLGANGGVLFDCLLFALIPFNPRLLCHREDRILADKRQISINFYIGARTALVRVPLLPKPNGHHKDARFTLWHGRPSSVFPFRPKPNGRRPFYIGARTALVRVPLPPQTQRARRPFYIVGADVPVRDPPFPSKRFIPKLPKRTIPISVPDPFSCLLSHHLPQFGVFCQCA